MSNWFDVMLTVTGPESEVADYVARRFPIGPRGWCTRYSGKCARREDGLAIYRWTTTWGGPDLRGDSDLYPTLTLEVLDVEPNIHLRWRQWEHGLLTGHIQPSTSVAKGKDDVAAAWATWFNAFDEMLRVQGVEQNWKVLRDLGIDPLPEELVRTLGARQDQKALSELEDAFDELVRKQNQKVPDDLDVGST
jgi:hypothetical protein